jgi:hypothetical protein
MPSVNADAYIALLKAGVSEELACRYAQDVNERDQRIARLEARLDALSARPALGSSHNLLAGPCAVFGRLSLLQLECMLAIVGVSVLVLKAFT